MHGRETVSPNQRRPETCSVLITVTMTTNHYPSDGISHTYLYTMYRIVHFLVAGAAGQNFYKMMYARP